MTSIPSERTPLIPPVSPAASPSALASASTSNDLSPNPSKPQRTVTFDTHTNAATANGLSNDGVPPPQLPQPPQTARSNSQPVLSALNSKLRRRGSQGAPIVTPATPASKIGPQRTTKTTQKLKLLPNPDPGEDGPDEESGRDVYSQFTRIKDPTARRDAARLGKADRDKLPRVTAYCTANAYRLDGLMKFLKGRGRTRGAAPKLFDECIYTPYEYPKATNKRWDRPQRSRAWPAHERRYSDSAVEVEDSNKHRREDLIEFGETDMGNGEGSARHDGTLDDLPPDPSADEAGEDTPDFDTDVHTPEVFLFNYGTVVIWGMSVQEEQRFLKEIAKFETEKLARDDVQTENFNFYYTREYQARIYNDFISLREKKSYMTKLAISHALSQSVKTSLFEDLVDNTIEGTKDIPERIALTGKVNLTRRQILMQVGELFILRINIHLQGSVLDSPELMWAEPQLDPVYQAVRSYLEMDQRVGLLTERLDVIADLLTVLKDQLTHTHGELLEWIVILLIAAEIVVAGINILVDLYAGVE
ncbi:MAG: hypothetical protein M1838_002762 [Thelocarpon superellum]|nr:MAG: hypothetical protein M1838_002762 [Thelocarpon superellum]